jgi:hypothetical protein
MFNIFVVIFCLTLAYAFFDPVFFVAYLISIAMFGLYQAMFMANAGGAWDNAKKVVEVELQEKNTPLHDATVIGDTVGDPFKDTSSVALNPIIKFTTLFGVLAVELSVANPSVTRPIGVALLAGRAGLRLPLVLRHAHLEHGRRGDGEEGRGLGRISRSFRTPLRPSGRGGVFLIFFTSAIVIRGGRHSFERGPGAGHDRSRNTAGPVRDPGAPWRRRDGRGLPRARRALGRDVAIKVLPKASRRTRTASSASSARPAPPASSRTRT